MFLCKEHNFKMRNDNPWFFIMHERWVSQIHSCIIILGDGLKFLQVIVKNPRNIHVSVCTVSVSFNCMCFLGTYTQDPRKQYLRQQIDLCVCLRKSEVYEHYTE